MYLGCEPYDTSDCWSGPTNEVALGEGAVAERSRMAKRKRRGAVVVGCGSDGGDSRCSISACSNREGRNWVRTDLSLALYPSGCVYRACTIAYKVLINEVFAPEERAQVEYLPYPQSGEGTQCEPRKILDALLGRNCKRTLIRRQFENSRKDTYGSCWRSALPAFSGTPSRPRSPLRCPRVCASRFLGRTAILGLQLRWMNTIRACQ